MNQIPKTMKNQVKKALIVNNRIIEEDSEN